MSIELVRGGRGLTSLERGGGGGEVNGEEFPVRAAGLGDQEEEEEEEEEEEGLSGCCCCCSSGGGERKG